MSRVPRRRPQPLSALQAQSRRSRLAYPAFDYRRTEPCIVQETAQWAVVYKPPRMPSAPLTAGERGTLVAWFLQQQGCLQAGEPSGGNAVHHGGHSLDEPPEMHTETAPVVQAAQVRGKKAIEAGLLHRLDTDTRGLVLFAKTQTCYDFLSTGQDEGLLNKRYYAFVAPRGCGAQEPDGVEFFNRLAAQLPYTIESQFRNFGPGAKRVAPVFPGARQYKKDGRLYTTTVEKVEAPEELPLLTVNGSSLLGVHCRLSRGYRHQIRAHLASLGLPIVGDPLYGNTAAPLPQAVPVSSDARFPHTAPVLSAAPLPHEASVSSEAPTQNEAVPSFTGVGLQLYAVSLSFPDPENPRRNISVALPPPDRMNP